MTVNSGVYLGMDTFTQIGVTVLLLAVVVPALLHIYTRIIADAVYKSKTEFLVGMIKAGMDNEESDSNE